jgi:hypothetical protein
MIARALRAWRILLVAYVTATLVHVGWVMAHEPFAFDAWNMALDTKAQPFSLARFVDYWSYEYTHSNPRIGQAFTYLAYKLEYFSVIATPLAHLALALGILVLGLGRWPRRGREWALGAIVLGFMWFAFPQLGKTLFNRAYGANYVYGAAIQTWFLVMLRVAAAKTGDRRVILYLLAGFLAGLCNEHTGPTLCLFLVIYAWRSRLKHVYAATAGAILGFSALFFAPGQGERYDSLAQKTGLFGKLLARGITGNLDIVRSLLLGAAPLLALIVIVVLIGKRASTSRETSDPEDGQRRRDAHRLIGVAMAAGVLVAMTLFVSPKLGPRFFIMPLGVLLAGFVALCDVRLTDRQLIPFAIFAVVASGYAALHTISLYKNVKEQSDERLVALAAAPPGSVFTAESYEQVDDSWWFLGDDFRDIRKRQMIARYYGFRDVVFRAYDPEAPLGITDVRLVVSSDPILTDGFELGWYKGIDVASIHEAFVHAVGPIRDRIKRIEMTVQFVGERPKLPRDKLLVAGWEAHAFKAYNAKITRKGRQRERTIELEGAARLRELEIYIYQVGGEARRLGTGADKLTYIPWKTGAYWVLACTPTFCYVTAAARQSR